jgi:hypothetical protein
MTMKFYQEYILKEEIIQFKKSYQKCFSKDSSIKKKRTHAKQFINSCSTHLMVKLAKESII